jgi:hypothetical protein
VVFRAQRYVKIEKIFVENPLSYAIIRCFEEIRVVFLQEEDRCKKGFVVLVIWGEKIPYRLNNQRYYSASNEAVL